MEESDEAAEADVTGICRQNLLNHISRMQDGIDDRLAVIERQVTGMLMLSLMIDAIVKKFRLNSSHISKNIMK